MSDAIEPGEKIDIEVVDIVANGLVRSRKTINQLESELAELRAENQTLRDQAEYAEELVKQLRAENEQLKIDEADFVHVNDIRNNLQESIVMNDRLKKENATLNKALEQATSILKVDFICGNTVRWSIPLLSTNLSETAELAAYLEGRK